MPSSSPSPPPFFTSEKALARRFRQSSRSHAFGGSTASDLLTWQRLARRAYSRRLGLDCFKPCPPRALRLQSQACQGYVREEWRMQAEADVWMPFSVLIPEGITTPAPAVVCPHGHSGAGKWAVAGRREIAGVERVIDHYNYDYGVQLARCGIITICPDARGFGERREPTQQNDLLASSCHALTLAAAPLGLTVQGMWTWDLMRLVDWLTTDKRIDSSRLGCAGLSGGGMQTLNLAALDMRIKAAVVSGYFYGVHESLQVMNMNCMCNLVPGLWQDFDLGDIGALVAPRPLFIESGASDELNGRSGLKNVLSQVAITRRAYKAAGHTRRIAHHAFEGGHRWDGGEAIPWLRQQLES